MQEAQTLVNQAKQQQRRGRFREAQALYQQVLDAQPEHCEALHYMGLLCQKLGSAAAGLDYLRRSVARSPGDQCAQYHKNLATALGAAGRLDEALAQIEKALAIDPTYAQAWGNKGVALERRGRLSEAEAALRKALELDPRFADGWTNLANLLTRQGKEAEALELLGKAAGLFPKSAPIAVNHGNALRRAGRLGEAIGALRQAVERRPDFPEAHNNLGVALHDAGLFEEAQASLRKAIELNRNYAEAHWNLSLVLLHRGDFHDGWLEYEWRRHLKEDALGRRNFPQPAWNGAPLDGRRILVLCEQGLGDTIQFIRFASVLAGRGAKVIVECQPRLCNLLRRVEGIEKVVARGEPLPPFDCHVRLMSIPGMLGIDAASIPAHAPYIRMEEKIVEEWRSRLEALCPAPALRIGIAWQGNPSYRGDPQRSIPLSAFAPLAQIPGVRLVSLQKGKGTDQIEAAGPLNLLTFDPPLDEMAGAFFDTAALMRNLDLVITSDTSVAHLAGALGVAT